MKLTIQERIQDLRSERGLSLEQLAEQTGLSKSALGNYETDETKDISHYALIRLAKFYGVTTDYLLGLTETKRPSDADADSLRLSNELMEKLRNGKINTAMLNEMAAHRDFNKLLADMEIYVDGFAEQQIQSLNAVVNAAREKIIEKYHPDEYDSTLHLLSAMEVQEGEYFSRRVHDDIDGIMADIKRAHAQRQNKPADSLTESIKCDIEEAMNSTEDRVETLLRQALTRLGVPYAKVTEEEKQTIINVLRKSKRLQSGIPMRGKGKQRH